MLKVRQNVLRQDISRLKV